LYKSLIALLLFGVVAANATAAFPTGQVAIGVSVGYGLPPNGVVLLFTPTGTRM
jgi:hypothetical protein